MVAVNPGPKEMEGTLAVQEVVDELTTKIKRAAAFSAVKDHFGLDDQTTSYPDTSLSDGSSVRAFIYKENVVTKKYPALRPVLDSQGGVYLKEVELSDPGSVQNKERIKIIINREGVASSFVIGDEGLLFCGSDVVRMGLGPVQIEQPDREHGHGHSFYYKDAPDPVSFQNQVFTLIDSLQIPFDQEH